MDEPKKPEKFQISLLALIFGANTAGLLLGLQFKSTNNQYGWPFIFNERGAYFHQRLYPATNDFCMCLLIALAVAAVTDWTQKARRGQLAMYRLLPLKNILLLFVLVLVYLALVFSHNNYVR